MQLNDLSLFEERNSPIHGSGLFLTRPVLKGTKLMLLWWDLNHLTKDASDAAFVPSECWFLPGERPGAPAHTPSSGSEQAMRACAVRLINHACTATTELVFEPDLPPCRGPNGLGRDCLPEEIAAFARYGYNNFVAVYARAVRDLSVGDEITSNYHHDPHYILKPEPTWTDAVCPDKDEDVNYK
jgi:hypothetical protein